MSAPEPQRGLIHALCHELSNLMAGVRLHTHLITPGAPPGDLENAASKIADVSLRAGALVAQVRPLLAPGAQRVTSVAPADVLAELELFLDDETPRPLQIDSKAASDLPPVRADAEILHHVLVIAVLGALEAVTGTGRVRVGAELSRSGVAFVVADDGCVEAGSSGSRLAGRPLGRAVAEVLLAPFGGRVLVTHGERATEVAFTLERA